MFDKITLEKSLFNEWILYKCITLKQFNQLMVEILNIINVYFITDFTLY
jgi:hypothetical protein